MKKQHMMNLHYAVLGATTLVLMEALFAMLVFNEKLLALMTVLLCGLLLVHFFLAKSYNARYEKQGVFKTELTDK